MKFIIENTYQLLLLMGVIFVLVGSILYKFPPKKINVVYGYRTTASMKSIERWNFAQQFSSVRLMQIGIIMMAISFLKMVFKLENEMLISLFVLFSSILFLLLSTENAIRNKFPSNVD